MTLLQILFHKYKSPIIILITIIQYLCLGNFSHPQVNEMLTLGNYGLIIR